MRYILGVCLFVTLYGCGPKPVATHTGSTGKLAVGKTSVWYAADADKMTLLVWSDRAGEAGGTTTGGEGTRGYITSGGKRIEIARPASGEKAGSVMIDHTSYDLANGRIFLVSTSKEGQTSTIQLKRDISQLKPSVESLQQLANDDPEIAKFVAAAESN